MTALARVARAAAGLGWWFALSALIGVATVAAGVGLVGTAGWLIATAALAPPLGTLRVAIAGVRFFGLARAVLRYLDRVVAHGLALRLLERLRGWILACLEPLAPGRLLELRSADLLAHLIGDVELLEQLPVRGLTPPVVTLLAAVGAGLLVGAVEPRLGVLLAASLVAVAVVVPAVSLFAARAAGRRSTACPSSLVPAMVDAIQGAAELTVWRREDAFLAHADELSAAHTRSELERARITSGGGAALALLGQLTPWLLLVVGVERLARGAISGVELAVVVLVALAVFEVLEPLPAAAAALGHQAAAAGRVMALIDRPPTVREPCRPLRREPSRRHYGALGVVIRGVGFRHQHATLASLTGLDLEIRAGTSLAIVGPSGAGKTTLGRLLVRVWDPTAGAIELDGVDLRDWRLAALRRTVVLLGQETRLFAGTIRDNLRLAAPAADDRALGAACRAAGLEADLAALPAGLGSWIGEGGLTLSGGQRRRLEIARTWLADPAVVVLDEPTAHLDPVTEARVLASFASLLEGRTAVVITHRLGVAARADRVVALDGGRIVATGSHAELVAGDGAYARWWRQQRSALAG